MKALLINRVVLDQNIAKSHATPALLSLARWPQRQPLKKRPAGRSASPAARELFFLLVLYSCAGLQSIRWQLRCAGLVGQGVLDLRDFGAELLQVLSKSPEENK